MKICISAKITTAEGGGFNNVTCMPKYLTGFIYMLELEGKRQTTSFVVHLLVPPIPHGRPLLHGRVVSAPGYKVALVQVFWIPGWAHTYAHGRVSVSLRQIWVHGFMLKVVSVLIYKEDLV